MRVITGFLGAILIALASGCGGQPDSSQLGPPQFTTPAVSTCTLYRTGSAITVTLRGPGAWCDGLARAWSRSDGTIWALDPSVRAVRRHFGSGDLVYVENVVCELVSPFNALSSSVGDGEFVFTIRDEPGASIGATICENLVTQGWYLP